MAAARERTNPVKSAYGSLSTADDDSTIDLLAEPYNKVVGVYAEAHRSELREPVPKSEPAPPKPAVIRDPRADLEPPAPKSFTSASELVAAIQKHQAHAWDPEERFGAPQTTSQQCGWGARKQPAETVRYPKVVSETTRTAELLFKTSKQELGGI